MESYQVRRIPVVNREGQLVGIISLADVATRTDGSGKKAEMVGRADFEAGSASGRLIRRRLLCG